MHFPWRLIFVLTCPGWVSKGVFACLRSIGCELTVTEVNPIKAQDAYMNGFKVSRIKDDVCRGAFFITCTGQTRVYSGWIPYANNYKNQLKLENKIKYF